MKAKAFWHTNNSYEVDILEFVPLGNEVVAVCVDDQGNLQPLNLFQLQLIKYPMKERGPNE